MSKLELRSFLRTTYLLFNLSICYLFITPWKTVSTNHHPSLTYCPYDTFLNFKFRIVFRNNHKIYFNLPLPGPAILVRLVRPTVGRTNFWAKTPLLSKMILVFITLDFYGRFWFKFSWGMPPRPKKFSLNRTNSEEPLPGLSCTSFIFFC